MRKIPIRLRLTLVMTALLVLLCAALTLLTQWQSNALLVQPVQEHLAVGTIAEGVPSSASPYAAPAVAAVLAEGAEDFTGQLWWTMGAIVLLGAGLTYWVSLLALRPVQKLSQQVAAVDETSLSCDLSAFSSGDEVGQLAASFDELLERLRSAFARERRFSAYAAHEMKTPLAVIKTALDVVDEEDLHDPEVCRDTLQAIERQNDRMIDLTGQLLLLSKAQQPQISEPIQVARMVEEIAGELAAAAQARTVTLHMDLDALSVTADPLMLKQAISNVMENAIRYNRAHGNVQIRLHQRQLIIADDGAGISEEDRAHIFEPFYRVDKSRSRSAGGTGLGLAITHEILTQSGFSIDCEPNAPQGCRFIITF